jgi:Tol biopolymer transport system component/DNA-binding winged helix-turn-helix (wHTH) protein
MRWMASNAGGRSEGVIRFADFKLDRARRTLSCRDVRLKLQPQPLRVLELLIDKAPATVSREEVRNQVWGDDINIDVEQNLNYCIRQIRLALGDELASPRFVETVPRQGYRFIGTVIAETANPIQQLAPPLHSNLQRWLLVGGTVLGTVLVLITALQRTARPREQNRLPTVSYVTTYPGDEVDPSFSPDGSQVAFSWGGNKNENRDIYVLPVGGQHPLRLTQDPADDISPAWSPDGLSIAFIRRTDEHSGSIMLIPALSGPERLLRAIRLAPATDIGQRMLAWSPDGRWLVFSSQESPGDHALFLLSLKTGAVRPIYSGHPGGFEDTSPAFSHDGRRLAFARFSGPPSSVLLVQRMTPAMEADGEPLPVLNAGPKPHSPAWDANGRLLFIDGFGIKRLEIGGPTRAVFEGDAQLRGLSLSGTRLIAVRSPANADIFAIPLRPGGLSAAGPAVPLISSTAEDEHPRFSPDGKHLAFASDRSGSQELWLADADGGMQKQMTSLGAHVLGFPRWSPGGQQIAFHARVPDTAQIFVLDVAGGTPRQITNEGRGSGAPSWSNDAKTLYVAKMIPGRWLVYHVPAEGGKEEPVFAGEGAFPVVAPGRELILYSKTKSLGIFSRALNQESASNVEEQLVGDYLPPFGGIYPVEDGIYYTGFTSAGAARAFRFYSFATKKSVDVGPAPAKIRLGLSVSPDRRRLAYCAEVEGNADLIMLELR